MPVSRLVYWPFFKCDQIAFDFERATLQQRHGYYKQQNICAIFFHWSREKKWLSSIELLEMIINKSNWMKSGAVYVLHSHGPFSLRLRCIWFIFHESFTSGNTSLEIWPLSHIRIDFLWAVHDLDRSVHRFSSGRALIKLRFNVNKLGSLQFAQVRSSLQRTYQN